MNNLSKLAAGSVIAATAALSGASTVLADGYAPKGKVVYERPADWSGVYFGLSSGYQWSNIDGTYANGNTNNLNHDSALVGTLIGIQHQFGQVVLGVEGNWLSTFRNGPNSAACPNPAFSCTHRLNDILTAGGRIGWAAGRWMPYATGGYASARFDYNATNGVNAQTEFASTRNPGWYIGGGVEWIVSPGWTLGVEYRHYEFDAVTNSRFNFNSGVVGAPFNPLTPYTMEASVDSITARVSWKFGREVAAPLK